MLDTAAMVVLIPEVVVATADQHTVVVVLV
jgi:hypothetical protein